MEIDARTALKRRSVLGLLAAGAITALTPTGAAGAVTRLPRTLAQPGATGIVRPAFAIDYVGVQWEDGASGGQIRFADPTGGFGPWQDILSGCSGTSALIGAGKARAYEAQLPPGSRAVALNCTDGPLATPAAATGQLAGRFYLSRAAWGADESLRFDPAGAEIWPPVYWPVQTVTVHHTADGSNDPDPAARVRAIYRFQAVEQGFGDIGYHFLIDDTGRIYEGRWSGTDGIPGFNPEGLMVNAAHVAGFNAGNVGIALLGNFMDQAPTNAARQSLTLLLALILGTHHIDPLATVHYVNPISGATRTVAAIPGHRDWAATLCPGDVLAGQLDTIRSAVAGLLDRITAQG
jgi:N-acetylmuramoyl-L-alanine amidase